MVSTELAVTRRDTPISKGEHEVGRQDHPDRTRGASRYEIAVLAGVVLLAIIVRLGPLGRGLGFDELFTAIHFVGTKTAWQTASTSINFNNHVAYSLLARLAVHLLGTSELALRLPAFLLGLASLLVTWRLARPVVGGGLAVSAAALLALSPEHVRWSTTARGYTGLLLGVLISSGLVFRLARRPSPWPAVGLAIVTALSAYFHLYAVPVAAVQGLCLLALAIRRSSDPTGRRGPIVGLVALAAGGVLAFLLYLPIIAPLLASIEGGGRGSFWPGFAWSVAQEQTAATPDVMAGLTLLVTAAGLIRLAWPYPWLVGYSLAIVVVPLLAVMVARPADLYARFFFYGLPFLLVALVVGGTAPACALRPRLPRRAGLLAWAPSAIGAVLLLWSWTQTFADFQVDEGFRDAVRALDAGGSNGVARCAVGAGAELFQWYSSRPLILARTVNELQQAGRWAPELRCVYRPASWEGRAAADIRRYLNERATPERFGDILLYRVGSGP